MIKVKGVSKRIQDKVVLENMDFEVKSGEILGLAGANGAGKTTLLNIIAGIWPSDKGDIEIDGVSINKGESVRAKIGYVPDAPFLYPKLTGREFLFFAGSLYKLGQGRLEGRIRELEKLFELSHWLDELMEGYPRGVRQKMTFAAMLLHSPKVLLLDEPLTNLDPKSSKAVKEMLQDMAAKGAAILLSTHILEIAEKLCGRIVVINKGQKIAQGSLAELRAQAKNPQSDLEDIFLQLTDTEPSDSRCRESTGSRKVT